MALINGTPEPDVLFGTDEADAIHGGAGSDYLDGRLGSDELYGEEGNDFLFAGDGDALYGGDGDDRLDGSYLSGGPDTLLDGGNGIDRATLSYFDPLGINVSFAGPTTEHVINNTTIRNVEQFEFYAGDGDDIVVGSEYDDVLYGGNGVNLMDGGGGNDFVLGGDGSDTLLGGTGDDEIVANSFYDGSGQVTLADGGTGIDTLTINAITGSDVNFSLEDPSVGFYVLGTAVRGIERINYYGTGSSGPVNIVGGEYDDVIYGGDNNDVIGGGAGSDTLSGDRGSDTVFGGAGDDYISKTDYVDEVSDTILDGGDGVDQIAISFTQSTAAQIFALGDSAADQMVTGTTIRGFEKLFFGGTQFDDIVTGGHFSDEIYGQAGNDRVIMSEGFDRLYGGSGEDTLVVGGLKADYYLGRNNDNSLTIIDSRTSNVRSAHVVDFEKIVFDNGTYEIENILFGAVNLGPTGSATASLGGGQGNSATVITTAQLLEGFSDPNADVLSVTNLAADHGYVEMDANGSYVITSWPGYFGPMALTYDVIDGRGGVIGATQNYLIFDVPPSLEFVLYGPVAEDAAPGTAIGKLIASDPDSRAFFFSLGNGPLVVDQRTGIVSVGQSGLDYELQKSVTVDAQVYDGDGAYGQASVSFAIENVIENQSRILSLGADIFSAVSDDNWTVDGRAGADKITTLAGADTVRGGTGNDVISTGGGDDVIKVGPGEGYDVIDGGVGLDRIAAIKNGMIIGLSSLANIEIITASGFSGVSISGSTAADTLDFTTTELFGITRIDGGAGNDVIKGSADADRIYGGAGVDTVSGGGGDDVIEYGTTADIIDGGTGVDTLELRTDNISISWASIKNIEVVDARGFSGIKIAGSTASETLDFSAMTLNGVSSVDGGSGNDVIKGSIGSDTIYGGTGNDTLTGGGGIDTLLGGDGNDKITGGAGADVLTGGVGTDNFIFNATSESGRGTFDRVTDFLQGTDKIDLSAIDANFTSLGNGAFSFIGGNAFSKMRGELRIDTSAAGHTSVYGDTDGNGIADLEIRVDWHGLPSIQLAASDFML